MPNYRYHTPDRTRRNPYGCPGTSTVQNYGCSGTSTVQNYGPSGCQNTDTKKDSLYDLPLAMAYVPWQEWGNLYELDKAFMVGTIFEDLNKPFWGAGGCSNGR